MPERKAITGLIRIRHGWHCALGMPEAQARGGEMPGRRQAVCPSAWDAAIAQRSAHEAGRHLQPGRRNKRPCADAGPVKLGQTEVHVRHTEVEAAARAIGAHGLFAGLPEGYDTVVGKRGGRLSSGQRQLVAFARAFLAAPQVLILDEASSALDAPHERLVQDALHTLLAGRTAVIIAHRLSTVDVADRVLVVDGGRIVQDGAPEELRTVAGAFRRLNEEWAESLG